MPPLVAKEWRKILYRVRRYGCAKTGSYVVTRVRKGTLPLALSLTFAETLLKKGEHRLCGRVLTAVRASGEKHALLDELVSSWLWCTGNKQKALSFILRRAKYWNKSYLYAHAGIFHRLKGNERKADYYFEMAEARARKELQRKGASVVHHTGRRAITS